MPEETKDSLSPKDLTQIAEWLKSEQQTRESNRSDLESHWKEIDRQIAMEPIPKDIQSGEELDWYPNVEEPLQFNTLEVLSADVRKLLFPKTTEWYFASAELSDKYLKRFQDRRQSHPLIGDQPLGIELDQDTANSLTKAYMDFFHRTYDFRANVMLSVAECIKYGTACPRVKEVSLSQFVHGFRGLKSDSLVGPALVPTTIKNVYLDDAPSLVMHEGVRTSPTQIRVGEQLLSDLQRAAKVGGKERGWILSKIKKLEPLNSAEGNTRQVVKILEGEGDFIIPRSQGSLFLPNSIVTVAVGASGPEIVRYQKNPLPWRSYVPMYYMRQDIDSAYGVSPLMKGQPIQEVASYMLNDLSAAGALNARPPVAYDRNDSSFAASGGPEIYPGAKWDTDAPDRVNVMSMADVQALLSSYLAMIKKHEDLSGVNEPRVGGQARSHTSATSANLEASRGVARTVDFVDDLTDGPLPSILHMEYDIIKNIKKPIPVPVDAEGIEGWVNLSGQDLADNVAFNIPGSSGVLNDQERQQSFLSASGFALQVVQMAAQMGQKIDIDFVRMISEVYQNAGIQNSSSFVRRAQTSDAATPVEPGANGDDQGAPPDPAEALASIGAA